MISTLVQKAQRYIRLYKHRKAWRKRNKHNFTVASTFFPADKVKAGRYSYGDLCIISAGEENEGLEIGHFVSIATGVTFLLGGNHYYRRISNYPFIEKLKDRDFAETWSKGKIIVEDDVWIGTNAFIMSGITIGRGAIVGACSVVTKDVPPYAIVAGNPAVVTKYRFDSSSIDEAMSIDFKNLDPEIFLNNLELYRKEENFSGILSILNKAP